jgi:hypothetical protein
VSTRVVTPDGKPGTWRYALRSLKHHPLAGAVSLIFSAFVAGLLFAMLGLPATAVLIRILSEEPRDVEPILRSAISVGMFLSWLAGLWLALRSMREPFWWQPGRRQNRVSHADASGVSRKSTQSRRRK